MGKLSIEQFNRLRSYEDQLVIFRDAHYVRNVGKTGATIMNDVLNDVTGDNTRFDLDCNHCLADLYTLVGNLYFTAKAEYEAEEQAAAEEAAARTVKQVRRKK